MTDWKAQAQEIVTQHHDDPPPVLMAVIEEALERAAAQERDRYRFTLETALETMNRVSLHQTDRLCPPSRLHPLTCGRDSNHTPLYPYWDGRIVTMICRDCDYTQRDAGPCGKLAAPRPSPDNEERHLTADEQKVMTAALRRSSRSPDKEEEVERVTDWREQARQALRRGAEAGQPIPPCRCMDGCGVICNGICEDAVDHVAAALERAAQVAIAALSDSAAVARARAEAFEEAMQVIRDSLNAIRARA